MPTSGLLERVHPSLRPIVALALNDDGSLSDALLSLFDVHNLLPAQGRTTLNRAIEITQAEWRRAPKAGDIERNADDRFSDLAKTESLRLLDKLGQNGESLINPSSAYYDTALVHEHYPLEGFRRLEALAEVWSYGGVRFGAVAVLGCAMPVPPEKSIAQLQKEGLIRLSDISADDSFSPTTLVGSIGWLLRNGPFPLAMRQLPIHLISSPYSRGNTDTGSEYSVLPDTGDSLQAWWEATKTVGNVLAVSNGWQYPRQALLTWTELVKADAGFRDSINETIGGAPGHAYSVSMRLRELAGFLWTLLNGYLKPHLGYEG